MTEDGERHPTVICLLYGIHQTNTPSGHTIDKALHCMYSLELMGRWFILDVSLVFVPHEVLLSHSHPVYSRSNPKASCTSEPTSAPYALF
jgi:hypothetical protein